MSSQNIVRFSLLVVAQAAVAVLSRFPAPRGRYLSGARQTKTLRVSDATRAGKLGFRHQKGLKRPRDVTCIGVSC
jgi:hypothetical protein